jgi:hypothetical protein
LCPFNGAILIIEQHHDLEPFKELTMKTFALFFALQFLLYLLVTFNFRAIAQARYSWTILSDILISAAQFWIIRKVGSSGDSTVAWIGFVCGGAVGSTAGIWLSKRLFRQGHGGETLTTLTGG